MRQRKSLECRPLATWRRLPNAYAKEDAMPTATRHLAAKSDSVQERNAAQKTKGRGIARASGTMVACLLGLLPGGAAAGKSQLMVGGGATISVVEGHIKPGLHASADARYLLVEMREDEYGYWGTPAEGTTVGGRIRAEWRMGDGPRVFAGATVGMAWFAWIGPDEPGYRPDSETDLILGVEWAGKIRFAPAAGAVAFHQTLRRSSCYGTSAGPVILLDALVRLDLDAPELAFGLGAAGNTIPLTWDMSYYGEHAYCMQV